MTPNLDLGADPGNSFSTQFPNSGLKGPNLMVIFLSKTKVTICQIEVRNDVQRVLRGGQ